MDTRKRRSSSHSDQPGAKIARTEATDSSFDRTRPKTTDEFKIEIKLRSTTKAARNDPKLTLRQREVYEKVLLERSTAEPNDEDRRRACRAAKSLDEAETSNDGNNAGTVLGDKTHEDITSTEVSEADSIGEDKVAVIEEKKDSREDDDDDNDDDNNSMDDLSEGFYDEDLDEDDSRSEDDADFEFDWLEPIDVTVQSTRISDKNGKAKVVAYCAAKLIRRGQMRSDFYAEMEQPSEETSMLGFDIFDRYGRLRPEFYTHPFIKGTGIWGKELNHGDILLIEHIFVNQDCRRQQLGRRMVEALFDFTWQKTWSFFAFTYPSILRVHDIRQEWDSLTDDAARTDMGNRESNRAINFCRSLGFRRVGATVWFGMASKKEHASHKLASTEDFDPPQASLNALDPLLYPFQEISNPPPSTLDQLLGRQPQEKPNYLGVLRKCLQEKGSTDACWMTKDEYGNNILHLAASIFDVACVEWLLDQDFGAQLLQARNNCGETPLEMLQFKLEKVRTYKRLENTFFTVSMSDRFTGHSEDAVRCKILLKGLGTLESFRQSQGLNALLQLFGGCTCGQCLDGMLSPRMLHALLTRAEIGHDMLKEGDITKGSEWVEDQDHHLGYLPLKVKNNLETNKSMRQGFVNLWDHIATCLRRKIIPTAFNVLDVVRDACEWPPATKNFLQRGGTVESAFLAICREAMEEDVWIGSGWHQEVFGTDIAKLPECRNDLEFGFVSGSCGYRRINQTQNVDMWGNTLDEDHNPIDSLY